MSSDGALTVLSAAAVAQALEGLSLDDLLTSQTDAFAALSRPHPGENIQAPIRIALSLAHHTTLFMPSSAPAAGGSACKIVSVPKAADDTAGLPAMTLVLDAETGRVIGAVNASELTGVRTAAGSLAASRVLLSDGKDRTRLVVFGAGVQSFWHVHLHLLQFPSLKHVVFLAQPSRTALYPRLQSLLGQVAAKHSDVKLEHSCTPGFDRDAAVADADIILCCTPSTVPLFPGSQPKDGAHISLIGSYKPHMREVDDALLARAGVVFVDGAHETKVEAGELQEYAGEVCEIGTVIHQSGAARDVWEKAGGSVTLWKSVGLSVQDVAITSLVLRKAVELGLGQQVDFF